MADQIELKTKCSLSDIIPLVQTKSLRMQLVDDTDEYWVEMARCTTAADREELLSRCGMVLVSEESNGERRAVSTSLVPGRTGSIALGRYCWRKFVTGYRLPNGVEGHANTSDTNKMQAFEDLFGGANEAVSERFAEFCMKAHRLAPEEDARVADELGNSTDGASPLRLDKSPSEE